MKNRLGKTEESKLLPNFLSNTKGLTL